MVCLGDAGARADSFMRSLPLSLGVKVALGVAAIAIWAALPWLISRGSVDILVFTCVYAIAGLGVAFLLGQCGVVSVAQSVFYGIGAYSTAYGTTVLGWPIPVCMLMGIVLSGLVATIVGIPVLRLSGYFLALATLALAVIGDVLFLEWDWLTNGTLGIGGIPHISLFGLVLNTPFRFYYFVWPCAAIILWLHYNLLRSRAGIALSAIRDAPDAAKVIGVRVESLKLRIFVLSAVLGSLAGSLFAHYVSFVSVDSFGVDRAIAFLLIAVLGGVRSIAGTVVGALFVTAAPNLLSRLGEIHPLLFAVLLILAVIFLPAGFGGAFTNLWKRFNERLTVSSGRRSL